MAIANGERIPPEEPRCVEAYANEADAAHILAHLPFSVPAASTWMLGHSKRPERWWGVMRLDDNGRRSPIERCSSRCEAELRVRDFELRGHKQFYWFETSLDVVGA